MGVEASSWSNMGDLDPPQVTEAFQFFDADGDEMLTEDQFIKMVQSLGQTPTQAKLKELLDSNKNAEGLVDRPACDKMMPEIQAQKKSRTDVIEAFKVFDNRGDGMITVENFKQMMGSVGEKLTATEVQEAVAKATEVAPGESDGQAAIEYEKYVEWMMGKDA